MAAITSTPTTLQGCYDKLIYTYTNTIVGNANVMSIEVKVYIDSVLIATRFINAFKSVTEASGDYTYTYDIDISDIVQSNFINSDVFYPNVSSYPVTDSKFLAKDTQVKIFRYEPNASGVLTKNVTSTDSANRTYFNSLINTMTNYAAAVSRKFLTSETNAKYYQDSIKTIAIYSDSNVTHLQINVDGDVTRIALTQNQINIIDLSDYVVATSVLINLRGGTVAGESFSPTSESKNIIVKSLYCDSITLHYQNEFGMMDSFVFDRYEKQANRKNEYFTNSNYAVNVLNQEIRYTYNLFRDGFNDAEFVWFKNFINSTIFYIEVNSVFKQVTISDLTNLETKSEDGNIDIVLRFTESLETNSFTN